MLRWMTAGESHGQALIVLVDGLPSGLKVEQGFIDGELARRQLGFGRGGRMKIEQDKADILSGFRFGRTLGSPVALLIRNRDWENWRDIMAVEKEDLKIKPLTTPRPGHADFAGSLKMGEGDIRNVLERASARETAARVAAGALAKAFLAEFKMTILSHVLRIGKVKAQVETPRLSDMAKIDRSPVRCLSREASARLVKEIEKAENAGETLGGIFEVVVHGVPPGLGSYTAWDRRLDGSLARALMSIPAVKGVEIGLGFDSTRLPGSQVQDQIYYSSKRAFYRLTNRAGGIEGGMSNGQPIVLRGAMKPIPTLSRPLETVDLATRQKAQAFKERGDVCAVPAGAVIGESVIALEIASVLLTKFGSDCLGDIKAAYKSYLKRIGWKAE